MKNSLTVCIIIIAVAVASLAAGAQKAPAKVQKKAEEAAPKVKPVVDPTTGMEFVLVKGGCYQMGNSFGDPEAHDKPVSEACVTDFYLGKYEVTEKQWEKVMGSIPSANKQCGPDCPVDSVSWTMAQEFIAKLNSMSGKQYRLPTEAEWEYAARSGGKKEKWAGTSDEKLLDEFAWNALNSNGAKQRVGLKKPNGLGLYDMAGNVGEWCQDSYKEAADPSSPEPAETRYSRGGGWSFGAREVRPTSRYRNTPVDWDDNQGFRVLMPVK